jgi:hypothetical protein
MASVLCVLDNTARCRIPFRLSKQPPQAERISQSQAKASANSAENIQQVHATILS